MADDISADVVIVGSGISGAIMAAKLAAAGIKVAMGILAGGGSMTEGNRDVARKVRQEVGRVESLMRSFLTFARPPRPLPADVDVDALISSSLSLYGRDPRLSPDVLRKMPADMKTVRGFDDHGVLRALDGGGAGDDGERGG